MQETWAIHGVYPVDGLDAGQQVDRLLGRRQDPPHRRRQPAGRATSPSTCSTTRAGHPGAALPAWRWRRDASRPRCCAGCRSRPKGDRVVYQALGPPLGPRPARRHAAPADPAERSLGVLPRPSRATAASRLHDLGRRQAGHRARGRRPTAARGGWWSSSRATTWSRPSRPDGKQIVYRKIEGRLRPHRRPGRCEPGLYRRAGRRRRAATLITEDGEQPHFGAESDRVYLLRGGRARASAQLVSHRPRRQASERTHLTSENATEFQRLAGRPLGGLRRALQRLRDAVRRHRQGGRRRAQGQGAAAAPRSPATPASTCTGPATRRALHWSLGPELYTLELKNAFTFLDGRAREAAPIRRRTGWTSASRPRATCPRGRWRWSAGASSPCGATR